MNKNIINKNIVLYNIKKNKNTNDSLIMIISLNMGWNIFTLKSNRNMNISNILLGYTKMYKFFFKLKGFGFKWKYDLNLKTIFHNIFLKIGFTHRVSIIIDNNTKYKMTKKRFIIKNRSYRYIRNNLNFIFFFYKNFLYNKKGIYLRGTKYKTKISKKKSKF